MVQNMLKVVSLRHGKNCSSKEDQLKNFIQLTYDIIFEQRFFNVLSHVYCKRTYTLQNTSQHFIRPPLHVKFESDLHTIEYTVRSNDKST